MGKTEYFATCIVSRAIPRCRQVQLQHNACWLTIQVSLLVLQFYFRAIFTRVSLLLHRTSRSAATLEIRLVSRRNHEEC
jgi:hypothetical protein